MIGFNYIYIQKDYLNSKDQVWNIPHGKKWQGNRILGENVYI